MIDESQTKLGRYGLVDCIGTGGMADVYRAKFIGVEGFEKVLAIKKILPRWSQNREFVRMLIDEAKVLVELNHSNIVQVFELNKEGDQYYIVMEYVHGVDLRRMMKGLEEVGRHLPLAIACYIVQQIGNALQFAHEKKINSHHQGIIHRDVSPQNILLSLDGEIKVTDFGIAKVMGKTSETITGTLKGKFTYMSPEQAKGQSLDPRSDIFSLGILMYELVTGERCFKGVNDLETLEAVKEAKVEFSAECQKRLPQSMRNLLLKALCREPQKRFATVMELKKDLRDFENREGYAGSRSDLKSLTRDLFPELYQSRLHTEETSRTWIHEQTVRDHKTTLQKTRVLVAGVELAPPQPKSFFKFWHGLVAGGLTLRVLVLSALALSALLIYLLPTEQQRSKISGAAETQPTYVAKIHIVADPAESLITLEDGKDMMRATHDLISSWNLQASKKFKLKVAHKGFETFEEELALTPGAATIDKNIALKKLAYGTLTVAARPWAEVTVPGVTSGVETPFVKKNIPVGTYSVKVVFPPQGITLTKNIQVSDQKSIHCQATFGAEAKLTCF